MKQDTCNWSPLVRFVRVQDGAEVPPADDRIIDIALMDMNHRWPNMGHAAIVNEIRECASPLFEHLERAGLSLRIVSFDVRASAAVPEPPGDRFLLYIGTGGPGHIDPSLNRGDAAESQGIDENPSWEKPFHALLQAIMDDERAALLAVCHTFGVVCRWSGAAEPVVRGAEKGGKSSGLVENVLTEDALRHPWFSRFAAELPDGRSLTVIDSRFFDLLPRNGMPKGATAIGYEAEGPEIRSLTMLELARDGGGIMPRVFAVNHHPEVVDRAHALTVLELMWRRGDVTGEWYAERAATLQQTIHGLDVEALLRLTSQFTFLFPLQFHLSRVVRLRMEALGLDETVSEMAFLEKLMSYARESVRIE